MKYLGINIDHIATLRNTRDYGFPDLMRAVDLIAKCQGIKYITLHLREDRRHIKDYDLEILCKESPLPINMEMACTDEMVEIAVKNKPYSVCFVPEKREEMTTESGLNLDFIYQNLANAIQVLHKEGIRCSLFLDAKISYIKSAKELGVETIEIHTGHYSNTAGIKQKNELEHITVAAKLITSLGMACHAGHGLTYDNISPLAKLSEIEMFNIGHFLIGEAIYTGLENAINKMMQVINNTF